MSKQHDCFLKNQYVQNIIRGQKTWEGRCNTQIFKDYRTGDKVTFTANEARVTTEITDRRVYLSFEEMLRDVDYRKMVPEARSFDHAVSIYKNIPGYAEKAQRFGVVALGVRVCEPQATSEMSHSKLSYNR